MFWEKEYQPTIVGCELNDDELQQFINENGIGLQIVDNSTRWCAFAHYYAQNKGFDVILTASFAYMVSNFMTYMGISAGTEVYIKEEKLELDLIDKLNEIKSKDTPEEEQVKEMFNHIFKLYSENISDYEYSSERLSFKITPSQMKKFQSIEGDNNKEKFKNLLGGGKLYTISDNENSKELIRLGFPKNLCTSPKSCELLLKHCKKYNMKFLKGSYSTLVHKNFNKYFKISKNHKIEKLLKKGDDLNNEEFTLPLDHLNLFKSKIDDDVYILTSSPYDSLNMRMFDEIRNYPYSIYVIHPNFLDYTAFVDEKSVGSLRDPLTNLNYAFTNASYEQILNINKVIYEDLNTYVFTNLK